MMATKQCQEGGEELLDFDAQDIVDSCLFYIAEVPQCCG